MPRQRRIEYEGAICHVLSRKDWALKLRELGAGAGGADDIGVSMAARRIAKKATSDPALSDALKTCREKLRMLNV